MANRLDFFFPPFFMREKKKKSLLVYESHGWNSKTRGTSTVITHDTRSTFLSIFARSPRKIKKKLSKLIASSYYSSFFFCVFYTCLRCMANVCASIHAKHVCESRNARSFVSCTLRESDEAENRTK